MQLVCQMISLVISNIYFEVNKPLRFIRFIFNIFPNEKDKLVGFIYIMLDLFIIRFQKKIIISANGLLFFQRADIFSLIYKNKTNNIYLEHFQNTTRTYAYIHTHSWLQCSIRRVHRPKKDI